MKTLVLLYIDQPVDPMILKQAWELSKVNTPKVDEMTVRQDEYDDHLIIIAFESYPGRPDDLAGHIMKSYSHHMAAYNTVVVKFESRRKPKPSSPRSSSRGKFLTLLVLLIIILLPLHSLLGCTCDFIPTFVEDIRKETSIFQVEVLQHKTLPVETICHFLTERKNPAGRSESAVSTSIPLFPYDYTSYTILLVLDEIMGKATSDTIIFFNGAGSMCLASMENNPVGSKFILKLNESAREALDKDLKEHLVEKSMLEPELQQWKIYAADDCHQWLLRLDGDMVSGNITQNERHTLVNELNRDAFLSPDEREYLLKKMRAAPLETMHYQDFVRVIYEIEAAIPAAIDTIVKPFMDQIGDFDLSVVWTADSIVAEDLEGDKEMFKRTEILGFIGDNYQRFYIRLISVIQNPNDPLNYLVYGKTMVKENICSFQGSINIVDAGLYKHSEAPTCRQGYAVGKVLLFEDKKQRSSGFLEGALTTRFLIDAQGQLRYDAVMFASDDFSNNQFAGKWTSYKTGVSKKCNWGDYRIPDSGDLDIGAGEFSVNKKYQLNGWLSYSLENMIPNAAVVKPKTQRKTGKQWWE